MGHLAVGDDHVPTFPVQGFAHGLGRLDPLEVRLVATAVELARDQQRVVRRILDHQHAEPRLRPPFPSPGPPSPGLSHGGSPFCSAFRYRNYPTPRLRPNAYPGS